MREDLDPTFATKSELINWAMKGANMAASDPTMQIACIERIKRVTMKHAHLFEERSQ